MRTFDWALFDLYSDGFISYEEALRNADSVNELRLHIKLKSKRGEPRTASTVALSMHEEPTREEREQQQQLEEQMKAQEQARAAKPAAAVPKDTAAEAKPREPGSPRKLELAAE